MKATVTDAELADWENRLDIDSDLEDHFNNLDEWHWTHIGSEWRRLSNLMGGTEIEAGSLLEDIATAALYRAHKSALSAVAAALGVDADALEVAVDEWVECACPKSTPPQIGFSELEKRCAESLESLKQIRNEYRPCDAE